MKYADLTAKQTLFIDFFTAQCNNAKALSYAGVCLCAPTDEKAEQKGRV